MEFNPLCEEVLRIYKAHAIKILGKIWDYYDTKEGMELCQDALKSKIDLKGFD